MAAAWVKRWVRPEGGNLDAEGRSGLGQFVKGSIGIGEIGEDERLHKVGAAEFGLALDKVGLMPQMLGDGAEDILQGGSDLLYHSHRKAPVGSERIGAIHHAT